MKMTLVALALASCLGGLAHAQTASRSAGGTMEVRWPGLGVQLNRGSTVQRQWVTVHEPERLGLRILGPEPRGGRRSATAPERSEPATVGVTLYGRSQSPWNYRAEVRVEALESITAFEMRFLLFDIWGERQTTLVATVVTDLPAGATSKEIPFMWNVFPEADAEVFHSSVAWIDRVRLADGQVILADRDFVLEQAETFSSDVSEEDLIDTDIE